MSKLIICPSGDTIAASVLGRLLGNSVSGLVCSFKGLPENLETVTTRHGLIRRDRPGAKPETVILAFWQNGIILDALGLLRSDIYNAIWLASVNSTERDALRRWELLERNGFVTVHHDASPLTDLRQAFYITDRQAKSERLASELVDAFVLLPSLPIERGTIAGQPMIFGSQSDPPPALVVDRSPTDGAMAE